jgi:hypothetical protein
MLHHGIKNNLFLKIFPAKPSQLSDKTWIKTNSHIPAKMNQQEGKGAGIVSVSGLCAGRTMIEIKSFWKHQ